jgi:Mg2+/citrate symporter
MCFAILNGEAFWAELLAASTDMLAEGTKGAGAGAENAGAEVAWTAAVGAVMWAFAEVWIVAAGAADVCAVVVDAGWDVCPLVACEVEAALAFFFATGFFLGLWVLSSAACASGCSTWGLSYKHTNKYIFIHI